MKIPAVKYMRDFFPQEMYLRRWMEETWHRVSQAAGFQPWDGPIVEHLDLYKRKSGEEIVRQLYTLTDQGGRELAIRPEMTPTLARMVCERQASLSRPIKWYCISRMCRYERKQRGRLREFWQWNVDVLGEPGPIADAEVISVALDGMRAAGLTSAEIEVRINSRQLLAALLTGIGVAEERHADVYAVTDKRGKVPHETLAAMYGELGLPTGTLDRLLQLTMCESLAEVERFAGSTGIDGYQEPLAQLQELFELLACLGKKEFCRFDIGIVRGLAYYTGPVFEIFDKGAQLRALCGGGRYDRLLETMGAQPMPAVGFGLGDVVLGELLKDRGKLPRAGKGVDYHVIPLEADRQLDAVRLAQKLRDLGLAADYVLKPAKLNKLMKRASEACAHHVVFLGGREWEEGKLRVREMHSGVEKEVPLEEFPSAP